MKAMRTGVVGVGRMGQHHCRIYANLRQTNLIGIYDKNFRVAQEIASRHDTVYFSNVDDLLDQVDAISIATPTPTHYDFIMRCLERNIDFLVEKPLSDTLEQAEKLVEAVDHSNAIAEVGHIERFNPTYQELKNVLEEVQPMAINFRRLSPFQGSNKDVDVVLDLMVHDLDLVLDLTGRMPDQMSAFGIIPFTENLDHVVAQLYYHPGLVISLTASRMTENKIRSIEVTTREAYLEADLLKKDIQVHRRSLGEYSGLHHGGVKYRQESLIERILVPNVEPLLLEVQHFVQCVQDRCKPCVSVHEATCALKLAMQIRDLALTTIATPVPQIVLSPSNT
jgi:predicted dehydrogenase